VTSLIENMIIKFLIFITFQTEILQYDKCYSELWLSFPECMMLGI